MAEWTVAPSGALQDLATWFSSLAWPIDKPSILEMGEARGWVVVSNRPGKGARFDTALAGPGTWASVTVLRDAVTDISVSTTSVLEDGGPDGASVVRDAFVDQVDLVTEVFGNPPDERTPGERSSVRWFLPNGSALRIGSTSGSCSWTVVSPEFVEVEKDLEARGR